MNKLKQTLKMAAMTQLIASYSTLSAGITALPISSIDKTKKRALLMQKYCKLALKVLGIKVNILGSHQDNQNYFVVCNHLSYLDILIVAAHIPTCFVTSVEIKEDKLLGPLTKLGGCLYVERRNKKNIHSEINEITESLRKNINVTVFPEATSTNGDQLLRFRRPLYTSAIEAERNVLPLCLNYRSVNGEGIDINNRDQIYWYGDMSFFSHFKELMSLKKINVDLHFLKTISYEAALGTEELSGVSHNIIKERYLPCETV